MGHGKKKRNLPQPSKTASADHGGERPSEDNNPDKEQSKVDQLSSVESNQDQSKMVEDSSVESECQTAIAAQIAGRHAEAVRLMNETSLRYENFSLVHATLCKLHHLESCRIGPSDRVLFQNHLRRAVESALRAVSLSPDSEELGTLYGEALYKFSCEVEGFVEVLGRCEQKLLMENPLQHSRDASLSLKAMLMKEKPDGSKRIVGSVVKMGKSQAYWNAMSYERKMGLIELRIGDLKDYCRSFCKDGLVERVFWEGLGYADKNKTWKLWPCYYCDEKFQDYKLRMKHVEGKHEGDLQMKQFLFKEIDSDGRGSEVYDIFLANGTYSVTAMERVVFRGDPSCPLDDCLLRVEVEYGSASTCDAEVAVAPHIDAFTKWLFDLTVASTAEDLEGEWIHLLGRLKQEGMAIPMRFKEEIVLLQSLRVKQSELVAQGRSLQGMRVVCAQELGRRIQDGNYVRQSYESLIKKIVEDVFPRIGSLLEAVVGVLKEARITRQSNSISREVEDPEEASMIMAIHKKIQPLISELCRNEAKLTRSNAVLWRLLVIYKQASLDYRVIMVPLVRNFIYAKLEALVNEEEKQKADAAFEELFSEASLDTKKNTSKGNSGSKLSQKTLKDKKKIKDHSNVKDSKATSSKEHTLAVDEKAEAESAYFPLAAVTAEDFKFQEEELRKKLEHQRLFEEAAKQTALAKETMNEAAASPDEMSLPEEKLRDKLDHQRQFEIEEEAKQTAIAMETTDEGLFIGQFRVL